MRAASLPASLPPSLPPSFLPIVTYHLPYFDLVIFVEDAAAHSRLVLVVRFCLNKEVI